MEGSHRTAVTVSCYVVQLRVELLPSAQAVVVFLFIFFHPGYYGLSEAIVMTRYAEGKPAPQTRL